MINLTPAPSVRFGSEKPQQNPQKTSFNFLQAQQPTDTFVRLNKGVTFKGQTKTAEFEALPPGEKKRLKSVAKSLLDDANASLTLVGGKPAALIVMSKEDAAVIRKHRQLLDSDRFKFIVETEKAPQDKQTCNIYLLNIPEQKEMIEKNSDFLKFRFNDNHLTTGQMFNKLFSDESPLFDINNNHDLVGVVLGFPLADSLMFKVSREIMQTMRNLKVAGKDDTNANKFLALVSMMFKQRKPENIQSILNYFGINNPENAVQGHEGTYVFETWDRNSPEVQQILTRLPEKVEEAQSCFQTTDDVLKTLFSDG